MSGAASSSQAPVAGSEQEVLLPALARLGTPVLIFGVVFFLLSLSLTFLVSPDRFPVRMGDKIVRLSELQAEEYALKVHQAELLDERTKILKDSDAPVLTQTMKIRSEFDAVGPLLLEVEKTRKSFVTGDIDPIRIPKVEWNGVTHQLTLGGDVTDPGGRSVSILSAYVDQLRKLPMLQSDSGRTAVSDPSAYVQNPDAAGGTVSPFTIVITLPRGG